MREFTIISNNHWDGTVYENCGLPKQSPTVGMFVMPEVYIRLCSDLRDYLSRPLEFIRPDESRYADALSADRRWGFCLVARLGDVELEMLHLHDKAEARAKWERRVGCVRWDKLIYKLNDQNGATGEGLRAFDAPSLTHKVAFTAREHPGAGCCFRSHCLRGCEFIPASYELFGRNLSFGAMGFINECFERDQKSDT